MFENRLLIFSLFDEANAYFLVIIAYAWPEQRA